MRAFLPGLCLYLLSIAGAVTSAAQELPEGVRHGIRERDYDVLHLRADLTVDPAQGRVEGTVRIELEPLRPLAELCLDAYHLEVTQVKVEGLGVVEATNNGRRLCAPLPRAVSRRSRVEVRYSARPKAGMYFQRDPGNEELFFVTTYGEGGLHANWLPLYNAPNDKFTSEMVITVPAPYSVVSNGRLVEETEGENGERTFHWSQERPHPDYLIAFYVGDFERGELEPAFGEIPLAYWVPRGRLAEGAYAFRNTPKMVEVFSQRLGYRYPWIKYDQLAIPDYAIGAMEHTGVTGHNASVLRLRDQAPTSFSDPDFFDYHTEWTAEATIAHELAHHWFGDNLTCAHLGTIWLNESFASYLMKLWAESDQGADQLAFDVDHARQEYFRFVAEEHLIRPLEYDYFDSPNDIYNQPHTYFKGAAVLHMLRGILGDDGFFATLSGYLQRHEFANVESHDLLAAIRQATGRDLEWFFEDWITGGGHPQFEVESLYLEGRGLLHLVVRQVQPRVKGQGLFKLPVVITLVTSKGTRRETVWVEEAEESFFLQMSEKPRLVSFDGEGWLVAEVDFDKDLDELIYQAEEDGVAGRLRALRRLAAKFPTRGETLELFRRLLAQEGTFWGLRAEAARLLGAIRTPAAEDLAIGLLTAPEQAVRKAAVLALGEIGSAGAREALEGLLQEESHADVVGTALVALAGGGVAVGEATLETLLERPAWNDELRTAVARAAEVLASPELLGVIRPLANPGYNQEVRGAALDAWAAIAPGDRALHGLLKELAHSPSYVLQQHALEALGDLFVVGARPIFEEFVELDIDANLTQLARQGLERLQELEDTQPPGP